MTQGTMRLGAFFYATGHHVAGWRHPSSEADGGINLDRYVGWAKRAEAAKFDLIFLEDGTGIRDADLRSSERTARSTHFEPVTLLSALAAVTSRIGLVATTSTSFNEPYNVARRFASLDHLSAAGPAGTSSPPPPTWRRRISATTRSPATPTATSGLKNSWTWCWVSGAPGTTTRS